MGASGTGSSSPARSTSGCATRSSSARSSCAPPRATAIVRAVHRREDLYSGPELEKIPDLIVEFRDYAWLGKGNLTGRTETIWDGITHTGQVYAGSHRNDGIFVLAGAAARPISDLSAGIADVAPTVMYLLGEPIPSDLEGRLLTEAFEPALLDAKPPEYADPPAIEVASAHGYEGESPAEVEQRLRSLGYLE